MKNLFSSVHQIIMQKESKEKAWIKFSINNVYVDSTGKQQKVLWSSRTVISLFGLIIMMYRCLSSAGILSSLFRSGLTGRWMEINLGQSLSCYNVPRMEELKSSLRLAELLFCKEYLTKCLSM